MKHFCVLALYASVGLRASDAGAVDFYEEHGGWVVGATDSSCGMTMEYEGPGATALTLLKDTTGEIIVGVTNSNWSAEADEKYDISFLLNDTAYGGGTAVGYKNGYRNGFMLGLDRSFEEDFRKGATLWVFLGETKIDQLSLVGSNVAFQALNRCLRVVKAEKDDQAREAARWEDIPKDPFAIGKSAPIITSGATPPRPLGSPARWVTANDYPSAALREKKQGVTTAKLVVALDGIPISCEVTGSSGSDDLDVATCTSLMRRARFHPARSADGIEVEGTFTQSINWEIPVAPPPPPLPLKCVAGEICRRE